jgi:lambda family phage minor tail protein L
VDATNSISALTSSGLIAHAVTSTPHTMETGDGVNILGAIDPAYNGDFIVTVIDDVTFTYPLPVTATSPDTGSNLIATRLNNLMSFGGNEYAPVAFTATGFEFNGQGALPLPKIQISNVNRILQGAVRALNDLQGAKFYRIRTFRKHLDDGSDPDSTAVFPLEVYKVNRKTNQNKVFIEFELASNIDQENVQIPGRQVIQNACSQIYRIWDPVSATFDYTKATCPYTAATYFDANDASNTNPALDVCSKLLTGCRARFGTNPLPTRAFPGVGGAA